MNTAKLVSDLRTAADSIERQSYLRAVPDITVAEAWRRLNDMDAAGIKIVIDRFCPGESPRVMYSVWDGNKYHESEALSVAVEMALAANRPGAGVERVASQLDCPSVSTVGKEPT